MNARTVTDDTSVEPAAWPTWRWPIAGLAAVLAIAGVLPTLAEWHGNLYDDAYIYLRYAQNILGGCALEWNCGAGRVEGFTSPLYLALLALSGAVGIDLEQAASWLGVFTWLLALAGFAALPVALGNRLSGVEPSRWGLASLLIAACFAGDQLIAINIASGMEGGLVALALLGVAWLAFDPRRLAVAAPVMVVVRPELGLATLLQPLLGRDHLRRAAISACVVFTLVTCVRLAAFTDVLPNTFWAKSGGSADHLGAGVSYVFSSLTRFPTAVLAVLGLFSTHRALRYLAAIVISWTMYFLWSGGDFYPYARLFAFLVPLATFVGITSALELLSKLSVGRAPWIAAAIVLAMTWFGRQSRDVYGAGPGAFANVERWAATGVWLERCLPQKSVAAVPIGALAYFSHAPVFDVVGLTDPVVAIEGERATGDGFIVGHERAHPTWTLSLEPAVVFLDVGSQAPIDSRQRLDLMFPETRLLGAITKQKLPYVSVSAPVAPGVFQLLFLRREVALQLDEACLHLP